MGDTIWVDVVGHADERQDNSIMLQLTNELDALSARLGVATLSAFYDYSVLEAEFAEFIPETGDGADESGAVCAGDARGGEWFEPGDALTAVRAIRGRLANHFEELGFAPKEPQAHWPEELMMELKHCEKLLAAAVAEARRFRFLIVP